MLDGFGFSDRASSDALLGAAALARAAKDQDGSQNADNGAVGQNGPRYGQGNDGSSSPASANAARAALAAIDQSLQINNRLNTTLDAQRTITDSISVSSHAAAAASHADLSGGISDASRKMARDAFLVFAMLGIPPEKAREMASGLTKGMDSLNPGAIRSTGNSAASAQGSQVRVLISQTEIDFSKTTISASNADSSLNITREALGIKVQRFNIEIASNQADPLILDLDGNGIDTTGLRKDALFDLDGDGTKDRSAWVAGKDALLALDRNGNGTIDDGHELFGDQNGAADGFGELAKYDDNNDGRIDRNDAVFSSLILLHGDGSATTLADEGIQSLKLTAITPMDQNIVGGTLAATGEFEREDGSSGTVGDVLFDMQA